MVSRRGFLTGMTACAGLAAAASMLPASAFSARGAGQSSPVLEQSPVTRGGKYRPPYRLGQGGSPLGNASSIAIDNVEARAVLENAWNSGIRFYDTSPFYGFGVSERRFGHFLAEKPREEYVLATKVGRIFTATDEPRASAWANPAPFDYVYDYSASGTRRSIEDSLQRLGVSSLELVFIHDLSPDNGDMLDNWQEHFEQAANGAMPELTKMREEGIIKGWGMGVNTLQPIMQTLERADPDVFLSACNYTLIDHEEALNTVFPACDSRGVSIVVGSPLNNGFLAGRDRFNYSGNRQPTAQQLEKRRQLNQVAQSYGIDLRTAALQFCAAPQTVSSVIPGARRPQQPGENVASMSVQIPADFWAELKEQGLIAQNAPVPT